MLLPLLMACAQPRVLVLGVTGLDPDRVAAWRADLPHLAAALDEGRLTPLEGAAESAQGWTIFATGVDQPTPSLAYTAPRLDNQGRLAAPAGGSTTRQGTPFWRSAADAGASVSVLAVPWAWPLDDLGEDGRMLGGLGTPDLRLKVGEPVLLAGDHVAEAVKGAELVSLDHRGDTYGGIMAGPRVPGAGPSALELIFRVHRPSRSVEVTLGEQGKVTVNEGSASGCVDLSFSTGANLTFRGWMRMRVISAFNTVRVATWPLMPNPAEPWTPVSSPPEMAQALTQWFPCYRTAGPDHLGPLFRAGLIEESLFLEDAVETFDQRVEMALWEWRSEEPRLLVAGFSVPDGSMIAPDKLKPVYAAVDTALGRFEEELGWRDRLILVSERGEDGPGLVLTREMAAPASLREVGGAVLGALGVQARGTP